MFILCYHKVHKDLEVQGFLDYNSCAELENIIQYNVSEVLEDNDIIYNDEIEYLCIYAHGSRVFRNPRKDSDIDFVLFYKGSIREDDLFNIFGDEDIYIEHVKCDFNPIKIDDESDIEYYIQKHDIEYHKNLNEARHNIKLALDDFEDDIQDQKPILTKKKILNYDTGAEYVKFLIEKIINLIYTDNLKGLADNEIKHIISTTLKELYNSYQNYGKFLYKYPVKNFIELKTIILFILSIDESANLNWLDVSEITNMNSLFAGLADEYGVLIKDIDLSEWDVSNVIDMACMFQCCYAFNSNSIANWDVSNVKRMDGMFYSCHDFNGDISNWDVSNVINMDTMFYECNNFNQDISNWNTSKVIDMRYMFYDCYKFNLPIGKWNVSNVVIMTYMFYNAKKFNLNLNNWKINDIAKLDAADMFVNSPLNKKLPSWYTIK